MHGIVGSMDVAALRDDPAPVRREAMEATEKLLRLASVREESQVVAEQDDRVAPGETSIATTSC
jgi:hypothetical protein